MNIIYYPEMLVPSEEVLKSILLSWGSLRTLVPPSQDNLVSKYLDNNEEKSVDEFITDDIISKEFKAKTWNKKVSIPAPFFESGDSLKTSYDSDKLYTFPIEKKHPHGPSSYHTIHISSNFEKRLELHRKIRDLAGEPIIDSILIGKKERENASESMLNILSEWEKDTHFFNDLKLKNTGYTGDNTIIRRIFDNIPFSSKHTEDCDWLYHDKIGGVLANLLREEGLLKSSGDRLYGRPEIVNMYMSVLAEEVKNIHGGRLITNNEYCVAAKSGINNERKKEANNEEEFQLVSLAIPDVFIDKKVLKSLSWERIIKIRKDLLPLAEAYYREVEDYQERINSLSMSGKGDEACEVFCDFGARVAASFLPFAKEVTKIISLCTDVEAVGFLNGVILPAARLLNPDPEFIKAMDITSISSAAGLYYFSKNKPIIGFDYLANLNRKVSIERMKGMLTCLTPKHTTRQK